MSSSCLRDGHSLERVSRTNWRTQRMLQIDQTVQKYLIGTRRVYEMSQLRDLERGRLLLLRPIYGRL